VVINFHYGEVCNYHYLVSYLSSMLLHGMQDFIQIVISVLLWLRIITNSCKLHSSRKNQVHNVHVIGKQIVNSHVNASSDKKKLTNTVHLALSCHYTRITDTSSSITTDMDREVLLFL